MKACVFMRLQGVDALVRKYQVRWEVCLDRKAHSYYLRGTSAL
jgi:hypothetical protein